MLERTGIVTVTDLRTRRDVLKTAVKEEHMERVKDAYLISDQGMFYLALNRPAEPDVAPWGSPQSNVTNGMQSVPVNGLFYAFDRDTGKIAWFCQITYQMMVLDQFQDLPILLFTSRYNKAAVQQGGLRRGAVQVVAVKSIDKRLGKILFDKPEMANSNQLFHALKIDYPKRTIELIAHNLRIRFYAEAAEEEK